MLDSKKVSLTPERVLVRRKGTNVSSVRMNGHGFAYVGADHNVVMCLLRKEDKEHANLIAAMPDDVQAAMAEGRKFCADYYSSKLYVAEIVVDELGDRSIGMVSEFSLPGAPSFLMRWRHQQIASVTRLTRRAPRPATRTALALG